MSKLHRSVRLLLLRRLVEEANVLQDHVWSISLYVDSSLFINAPDSMTVTNDIFPVKWLIAQINDRPESWQMRVHFGVKFWFLISALLLFLFFALFQLSFEPTKWSAFRDNTVANVLAALILYIVYDLGASSIEGRKTKEAEKNALASTLAGHVLTTRGIFALSEVELNNLTKQLLNDDRFVEAMISATQNARAAALIRNQSSIWRDHSNESYDWQNRLSLYPSDPAKYMWWSKQKAAISPNKAQFRVGITDSTQTEAILLSSGYDFDYIIVIDEFGSDIATLYQRQDKLRVLIEYYKNGRIYSEFLHGQEVKIGNIDFRRKLSPSCNVAVLDYKFPYERHDSVAHCNIEWSNTTILDLSEGFFYIQNPALYFVGNIEIDYSEIANLIDNVHVSYFIGELSSPLAHSSEKHVVRSRINGALLPGQGIMLIWDYIKSKHSDGNAVTQPVT